MIRLTRPRFSGCLFVLLALAVGARAQTVTTIVNNGDPANRIGIVIMGDGYTAGQLGQFASDAQRLSQALFDVDPWKEYQRYFNVYRVDVISNQSGSDHPESGTFKDTALDSAYNCSGIVRLICVNNTKVNNILSALLTPAQRDIVLLVVNDTIYGGSGGTVAVVSTNVSSSEIALHELGHSFGLLADEYGGPPPPACVNSVEPSAVNATLQTVRASIKWNAWIDAATAIPTLSAAPALPGLYQGASYCDTGLYRPTYNSKMRSLGVPYEQINVEQLTKRIYNATSPIDATSPSGSTVTLSQAQSQLFSKTVLLPLTHSLNIAWSVDGQQQSTAASYTLNGSSLSAGAHTVSLAVTDATALVRNDPSHLLTIGKTWNVTVNAACSYAISPTSATTGAPGGSSSVAVTAPVGCAWSATSNSAFLSITNGSSANGSVSYSVAANTGSVQRVGTLTVAGQIFTVTQADTTAGNLALGKTATQSSSPFGAAAGRAVDGNTDGNFSNGSVTHTSLDANAWWQVDLGASATVSSVAIYNRTDCCGSRLTDYWVFVSDTPFSASDTPGTLQFRAGTWSSHQTSTPNPSANITVPGASGRYVRVQLSGTDYLSLSEVQVIGVGQNVTNLALGKSASQSSSPFGAVAGRAVDGNTDGNFANSSVTHTSLDPNAWWQVDLLASATVNSVTIYNRTDCCGSRLTDYWVFVSNTPFSASDTPGTLQFRAGTWSSHQTSAPSPSANITVPSASGRYVRVQLSGTDYLSLSEIQILGN